MVPNNIPEGVPQGLVIGPLLWNIKYDQLLKIKISKSCTIVAFTDNIALIIKRKYLEDIHNLDEILPLDGTNST